MIDESNLAENIIALIFYSGIAFFFFGLWVGWILWGSGRTREIKSAWEGGHPVSETSIAPMLNPAVYANINCRKSGPVPVPQVVIATPEKLQSKPVNKVSDTTTEKLNDPNVSTVNPEVNKDDISAGIAQVDDSLGLIYSESPEQQDDLTAIKGVGKVLNGKLNDYGIYTYRQIAGWTDSIVDAFSIRLSFKDRVKRDDWVNQAKQFHKEKYGEDLS